MYKCEKGEKQYKMCKEAGADYCSDCPHGVKQMKTADELFEELGYKIKETTWKEDGKKHFIEYNSNDTQIQISLDTKNILITNILNIQELQAINKKCQELGWIE